MLSHTYCLTRCREILVIIVPATKMKNVRDRSGGYSGTSPLLSSTVQQIRGKLTTCLLSRYPKGIRLQKKATVFWKHVGCKVVEVGGI